MFAPRQVAATESSKRWLPIALIGLLAVTAGIVLPQALPSVPAAPKSPQVAQPPGKGPLTYTPPPALEPPDAKAMLTRLGIATAIVLVLCVVTLWLGKRWLVGSPSQTGKEGQLRLVETLALGNRCVVHLIHVGNRPVLIGADPSGIKTVVPLPESFGEQVLTTAVDVDVPAQDLEGASAAKLYQRAMVDESEAACLAR
jgi:flagellar biogenesis protein FliO